MSAFPPAAHDLLFLDDLLTDEEKRTRYAVRAFMVGLLVRSPDFVTRIPKHCSSILPGLHCQV